MSGPAERLRNNVVEVTSTLVTAFWLAALLTGQEWWLGALIVGYVAVVPIVKILAGETDEDAADAGSGEDQKDASDERDSQSADEALAALRERYARGELTEEQFERKLERLLEVETVEDASEYRNRTTPPDRAVDDRARPDGREREPEYE